MKNILCLSDSLEDVNNFTKSYNVWLYKIEQIPPSAHNMKTFASMYKDMSGNIDLSKIDLVIAEYIESLPLLFFMRKHGYNCPAIMIPHTNPYPLNILIYFLLLKVLSNQHDIILCGSQNAALAYESVVKIPAKNVCTFGIKNIYYKKDQSHSRVLLNLPLTGKILLYTGRLMNDKGINNLLAVYSDLKKEFHDLQLVLSVSNIDPFYYNQIASLFKDVILFYRLERTKLLDLYNAADLYISCATSIFETYGKSPLESIACGTPVVLPNWDGFRYYVNEQNGLLAEVNYYENPKYSLFQFAEVDRTSFVKQCATLLKSPIKNVQPLPSWAFYDQNMMVYSKIIDKIIKKSQKSFNIQDDNHLLGSFEFPECVFDFLSYYGLHSLNDLVYKANELELISRKLPGDPFILKKIHDYIFKKMESVAFVVTSDEEAPRILQQG